MAGLNALGGHLAGGNVLIAGSARLELSHATLGPAVVELGNPGNWDGESETDRSAVSGEVLFASSWRARASIFVGTSAHSLCGGSPPAAWSGSGTSAASSDACLQEKSMHASADNFVGAMAPAFEHGRAVAIPLRNSRLIDAPIGCSLMHDQSGRARPLDGDGDGFGACDIGALELEYSPDLFTDGFE